MFGTRRSINLKTSLEEKYEVKTYTFGENLTEGNQIDYSKKITDLSNAFDEIGNKFYNRNVGALILASDGIFNQGSNPVYNSGIEYQCNPASCAIAASIYGLIHQFKGVPKVQYQNIENYKEIIQNFFENGKLKYLPRNLNP